MSIKYTFFEHFATSDLAIFVINNCSDKFIVTNITFNLRPGTMKLTKN